MIAGEAHGRRINAPRGFTTRPVTARIRASIFSRLEARIDLDGARVLDVFAGSGAFGLEALSRGAAEAVFIDSSRAATRSIMHNLKMLGFDSRSRIIAADFRRAFAELSNAGECFDLVFIDAPYTNDCSAEVMALIRELGLVVPSGWTVVRQYNRAPELTPDGFDGVSKAKLGDHRIALYRRLEAPNPTE